MKTLTDITGTPDTAVWGQQAQQTTILNVANQQYPRTVILSTQGVRVARLGVAVGFPIDDLIAAAVALEPSLTWPPKITGQPTDGTIHNAGAATFTIAVNSEIAVTYQWQVSIDAGANWNNATGGVYSNDTTDELSISSTLGFNGYLFRCIATNASGVTISSSATLIVDPDVTSGPDPIGVVAPAVAAFTVIASGVTSLTYQWQLSTDGGSTWGDISATAIYTNVTTATLHITDSTGLNGNKYRCTVTDTGGSVHSHDALLTVT